MPELPVNPKPPQEGIRLNKAIADSGYCARRKADELISTGQVHVNGQRVTTLGVRIDPNKDHITIHGKPLPKPEKFYLMFHKPEGYVTSRKAGKVQKSIYELLPEELHSVDPAGRLDQDSSGLLILSNDGDFIFQITHPRFHVPKVYDVQLQKPLTTSEMSLLKTGILLPPENKLARMEQIQPSKTPKRYRITLITGYNRQIRRSVEALGNRVMKLKRVSFGDIQLGSLPVGAIQELTLSEINKLQQSAPAVSSKQGPKQGQKRPQNKDGHVKHQRQQRSQRKTDQ